MEIKNQQKNLKKLQKNKFSKILKILLNAC